MPKKILIVDDDVDVLLFLSTLLQDHGYHTVQATDGQEGLEKAISEEPDLILLDLMMPHKSGVALLSEFSEDDLLRRIPVIMVTGVTGETGISAGSFFKYSDTPGDNQDRLRPAGFVEKPIDPAELLTLVRKVLE